MKILNKAIDGLNVFMFVTAAGVHFGCSSLTTHDALEDCILAINDKTDWEQLADMLLYRNDSQRVYEYYSGLLNLFDSIKYCREERDKNNIEWKLVNYDEVYDSDLLEDASSFSVEDFYPNEYSDQSDTQISILMPMNTVYLLLPFLILIMLSLRKAFHLAENQSCTFWAFLPNRRRP